MERRLTLLWSRKFLQYSPRANDGVGWSAQGAFDMPETCQPIKNMRDDEEDEVVIKGALQASAKSERVSQVTATGGPKET